MKKGLFITFEGGEGCGKSTQSKLLGSFLLKNGYDVILTREPGGTKSAEDIRTLLVTGDPQKWDPHTEALLMFASRCEHFRRKINPALENGQIVICDRFADSSYAYQGYGRDIGLEPLKTLYHFAVGDLEPDRTFLLDIDPILGIERAKKRNLAIDERFEKESLSFHQKVRDGYLHLAKGNKNRFCILNATLDIDSLQEKIREEVLKLLSINR